MNTPGPKQIVLVGGPQDGREFAVSPDTCRNGVLVLPEMSTDLVATFRPDQEPALPDEVSYSQVIYRWDGTATTDGFLRFRREKPA